MTHKRRNIWIKLEELSLKGIGVDSCISLHSMWGDPVHTR